MAQAFLTFNNALILLQTSGALPTSKVQVSKPEPTTPEREKKRRKMEHKQSLAEQAKHVLDQLEQQGYNIVWTDGSAKWDPKIG